MNTHEIIDDFANGYMRHKGWKLGHLSKTLIHDLPMLYSQARDTTGL